MIVPMLKVLVVGPKTLLADVIATVQHLGRVHLSRTQSPQAGIAAGQLTAAEAGQRALLERVQAAIDGLLSLLAYRGKAAPAATVSDWDAVADEIDRRTEAVRQLIRQRLELEDELALIKSYHLAFEALAPLLTRLEQSSRIKAFGFISRGGDTSVVEPIRLGLKKTTAGRCEIYSRLLGDNRVATLVAYHVGDSDKIRSFFAKAGISELKLPTAMAALPMAEAVKQLKEKLHGLPWQIRDLQSQLDALSREHGPGLSGIRLRVLDLLSRLVVKTQVDESRFGFILQGYLPQADLPRLQDTLAAKYQGRVTVQVIAIDHREAPKVPVVLKNNPVVKPFELMLGIFNPPQYGTVDPTPFIAFFFPLYFGFIIGDIGYGLIMLAVTIALKLSFKKVKWLQPLTSILILCWIWTIVFGYIFGELFGDFGEHRHWVKPVIEQVNRLNSDSVIFLMKLSWFIGLTQVLIGLGIGLYTGIKHRNLHHILEPIGFAAGIFGVPGIFFTKLMPVLPAACFLPSLGLTISAVVILGIMAGVGGVIEIFGAIGNVLSYARLFAIGLSAAYLAYAANLIGKTLGLGWGIACHFIFFTLGLISPIMQPFRLQVVEFFTKFKYHDFPGKPYKPFKTTGGIP